MLKRVDRIQIAVADSSAAEKVVAEVFGGELVRRDKSAPLSAKRSTIQAGSSLIELLEPDGAGAVQDFIAKWSGGLFGAGFSVDDLDAAAHHFTKSGVNFEQSAGQLYLDSAATYGMRTVISQHHERAPVGAIRWIYEVTNVVADWKAAADRYARIFGLDASKFSAIESKEFRLHRHAYAVRSPRATRPYRDRANHRPQPCDGPLPSSAAATRSTCSSSRPTTPALSKAPATRAARASPRHTRDAAGLAELFIHPIGISRSADRRQPHRTRLDLVRRSRAREACGEAAREEVLTRIARCLCRTAPL